VSECESAIRRVTVDRQVGPGERNDSAPDGNDIMDLICAIAELVVELLVLLTSSNDSPSVRRGTVANCSRRAE
jgi:hypothetical protein